jgi:hypothetical protein
VRNKHKKELGDGYWITIWDDVNPKSPIHNTAPAFGSLARSGYHKERKSCQMKTTKMLALAFASVLAFSLTACSNAATPSGSTITSPPQNSSQTPETLPASVSESPLGADPVDGLTEKVNQSPYGDESIGLQALYVQLSYIAAAETESSYSGFASPDKISSSALYNFYLAMAQNDTDKYLSEDDNKYHIPIEAIQNTLDSYFSGYTFDPQQIVREPEGTCTYSEEAQEIIDDSFVGYGGPAWIELGSTAPQANGDIVISAHGVDMDGNKDGRTETIAVALTESGYQFKSYEVAHAELSPPQSESATPLSLSNTLLSESQSDELQFLSVGLSGSVDGSPVEKIFTDSTEIEEIANLIIGQKTLEDTDGLQVPADVIVATMQDGPGTNFKLTLFPAKSPALNENILVIQGDLFSFYTEIQAYEAIIDMLD